MMVKLFKTILVITMLCTLFMVTGCSTITEEGKVPEKLSNTVTVGMDVWCGNLTNLRRIMLRIIHVADPDWVSVCESRVAPEEAID